MALENRQRLSARRERRNIIDEIPGEFGDEVRAAYAGYQQYRQEHPEYSDREHPEYRERSGSERWQIPEVRRWFRVLNIMRFYGESMIGQPREALIEALGSIQRTNRNERTHRRRQYRAAGNKPKPPARLPWAPKKSETELNQLINEVENLVNRNNQTS